MALPREELLDPTHPSPDDELDGDGASADMQPPPAHLGLVEPQELAVVSGDVEDLWRRLGLGDILADTPSLGLPLVSAAAMTEVATKIMDGTRFYVEGTRLLGSDTSYALRLLSKALSGKTLQPREARTLRRTGKDLVTLLPFIIILLAPLTPFGHVLIFSFIQRFFPDFFPSPFTDRRQRLQRMYQALEMPLAPPSRPSSTSTAAPRATSSSSSSPPPPPPPRNQGRNFQSPWWRVTGIWASPSV
mmetsp:Transcript_69105/g.184151  ORF Transcript_69105/g.184151 Transcript_69105/m.184151 type:complete len:246 (-) Transcript_69105:64-801(-)